MHETHAKRPASKPFTPNTSTNNATRGLQNGKDCIHRPIVQMIESLPQLSQNTFRLRCVDYTFR